MAEDKMKVEVVKDAEVIVKQITLATQYDNKDAIKKITFGTDKGEITWKPKITRTVSRQGFDVTEQVPCEIDLLPKKIQEMNKRIRDEGQIEAKIRYKTGTVLNDGVEMTYRFITSQKEFDEWKVMPKSDIKTEDIVID